MKLTKCGEGGESFVLIGDMPNTNVVIKAPKDLEEIERAMEETHLIEILCDWKHCAEFIVQVREELIICDQQN